MTGIQLRTILTVFITVVSQQVFSQWTSYSTANSPIAKGLNVPLVCSETNGTQTYVFTLDTSVHMYGYNSTSGWTSYPQYDQMFDTVLQVYDAKIRNGVLWCLTPFGLKKYEQGNWTHYSYPSLVQCNPGGLYIENNGAVWFSGGTSSKGITRFNGTSWTHVNKTTHPDFLQDMGVVDIEMDEKKQVIWFGTNCFTQQSGVYAYDVATDKVTYINNGAAKYGCIHGVQPSGNKVFVGTSNYSSLRILENGTYKQSLNEPKVKWVTDLHSDPSDSNRVWVLNDVGLTLFSDTINYYFFDTVTNVLKGYGTKLSIQKHTNDSFILWVATNRGLFSLQYKNPMEAVSNKKVPGFSPAIVVYPNPSNGLFMLRQEQVYDFDISVTNILGEHVNFNTRTVNDQVAVDLSGMPPGIYILSLSNAAFRSVHKIELRH